MSLIDVLTPIGSLEVWKSIVRCIGEVDGSAYMGIDLTASSIHLGHLVPLIWMSVYSRLTDHPCYLVIGDFTTMIGDPSDRSTERPMLSEIAIKKNMMGILRCLKVGFPEFIYVYNSSWWRRVDSVKMIDITRGVNLSEMLSWSSFKNRVLNGGFTLSEALYPMLQAYDFKCLNDIYGVSVQIAGKDQVNNVKLGFRMIESPTGACLLPLLETADGKKIGKSTSSPLWLSYMSDHSVNLISMINMKGLYLIQGISNMLYLDSSQLELSIASCFFRISPDDFVFLRRLARNNRYVFCYQGKLTEFFVKYLNVKNISAAKNLICTGNVYLNNLKAEINSYIQEGSVLNCFGRLFFFLNC